MEKGSVAIDGISLTVAKVDALSFAISAIPHTVAMTTLRERQIGDLVNLETDIIGKYVERFLCPHPGQAAPPDALAKALSHGALQAPQKTSGPHSHDGKKERSGITLDFLSQNGF